MHTSGWQFRVFGVSEASMYLHAGTEKLHLPTLGKVAMLQDLTGRW